MSRHLAEWSRFSRDGEAPPATSVAMWMGWSDLLFAHWPLAPEVVQRVLPAPLEVDTHEGLAWVAIAPFTMHGVRPAWLPAMSGLSRFPELNVRTYGRCGDDRGVVFLSLDAGSTPFVEISRRLAHLNYLRAHMRSERVGVDIAFESVRVDRRGAPARLRAHWAPTGDAFTPAPGTLEHWLVERRQLLTVDARGRVLRLRVEHAPWRLRPATARFEVNEMLISAGLPAPAGTPLLHAAEPLLVAARWPAIREPNGRDGAS